MPKNVDPFSLKLVENTSVIIRGINSAIINPKPVSRKVAIAKIVTIQEQISGIGNEISEIIQNENHIIDEYKLSYKNADNITRIKLLENSNKKIQKSRRLIESKKEEREFLEGQIDFLLSQINGAKQKAFQQLFIQVEILNPDVNELLLVYELKKDLIQKQLNSPIINETTSFSQLDGYWLIGQTIDSKTNELIPNARVNIYYLGQLIAQSQTNFDGQFKVELLQKGIYQVMLSKPGYKSKTERDIIVELDHPQLLQLELKKGNKINAIELITLALPMVEIVKDVIR
jgi:hypothetical protein